MMQARLVGHINKKMRALESAEKLPQVEAHLSIQDISRTEGSGCNVQKPDEIMLAAQQTSTQDATQDLLSSVPVATVGHFECILVD